MFTYHLFLVGEREQVVDIINREVMFLQRIGKACWEKVWIGNAGGYLLL